MKYGSVFTNNRTQAVRLPVEARFHGVKKVTVRVVGQSRILTPVGHTWDDFFAGERVDDDFMEDYEQLPPQERESFD